MEDQLKKTNEVIRKAANFTPLVMRPPYGNTNKKLNKYIAEDLKLSVIVWSYDTNDWKRPPYLDIIKKTIPKLKVRHFID